MRTVARCARFRGPRSVDDLGALAADGTATRKTTTATRVAPETPATAETANHATNRAVHTTTTIIEDIAQEKEVTPIEAWIIAQGELSLLPEGTFHV